MPRVSVVLPAYNCARYLEQAADSILQQSERDLELIIVAEMGSQDGTDVLLNELDDPRVRIVRSDVPLGLIRSLNRGFAMARGEYVARMDADDISLSERLERQAAFLDANPSAAVVGSAVRRIDGDGREIGMQSFPTTPGLVLWHLHFGCAMCHPSTMLRRSVFEEMGGYSHRAKDWEDYELWSRLMRYHDLANLPEVLLEYRIHPGSVCSRRRDEQREHVVDNARRLIEVTMGRPVERSFVKSLVFPYTIDNRRDAIGAAWLLNYILRVYRSWYKVRTREEGIHIKEDASTRLSHMIAHSVVSAPGAIPMILWQASRGGPGLMARVVPSVARRSIERLGGNASAKMDRRTGAISPSTQ